MWIPLLWLAAAAELDVKPLHAPEATASSFLQNNWNKFTENYHPSYVLDDNPRTAWVEGVAGHGEGEWLELPLSRVSAARSVHLKVRNGYQKSESLHRANAAPTKVRVELLAATGAVHTEELVLDADAMGWQTHVITPPAPVAMRGLRLTVLATRAGSAYKDTCISDVQIAVVVDEGTYSQLFENAKRQQLLDWIGSRQEAAAFFADAPSTWPFAASHFSRDDTSLRGDEATPIGERLAKADATWAEDYGASTPWMRVDGSVPRLPDGLQLENLAAISSDQGADDAFSSVLPRWLAPELTFSEASAEWRYQKKAPMGQKGEMEETWFSRSKKWNDLSNVKVVRAHPGGEPAEVVFQHRRSVYFRSVEDQTWRGRVTLDPSGKAKSLLWARTHGPEEGCESGLVARELTFERDDEGRVKGAVEAWAYGCPPLEVDRADPIHWRARRTTYAPK